METLSLPLEQPTTGYGTQPLTFLITKPKFGRGLNVSTTTAPNHGVVVIGWGECLVPELVPDDDVSPCGVEGMSPMVVGESWIMQNSWGATRGYKGVYFVNINPQCDTVTYFWQTTH